MEHKDRVQTIKNPGEIHGGIALDKFSEAALKETIESLRVSPTNAERLGQIPPITKIEYESITGRMQQIYGEKYPPSEDEFPEPDYQFPYFTYDSAENNQEFQYASQRAADVYAALKTPNPITGTLFLLGALKEAYDRSHSGSSVASDITKIYQVFGFGSTILDNSETLKNSLIDSPQSPQDYMTVFTKLLADERRAYLQSEPIILLAQAQIAKVKDYLDSAGYTKIPLPDISDMTFVENSIAMQPVGPIFEREYTRGNPAAIIHGPDGKLDKNKIHFTRKAPMYFDSISQEDIERETVEFTKTTVHEWIHAYGEDPEINLESGSWEEAIKEMITDAATLEIMNRSGIWFMGEVNSPGDWRYKTGYHQLMKLKFTLDAVGLTTPEDYLHYGMNQDYQGFSQALDQKLAGTDPQTIKDIIAELDRRVVIGPNQYKTLMEFKGQLALSDIVKAILDFKTEIGDGAYGEIGYLLISMHDGPSEEFADFIKNIIGTYDDRFNEEMRQLRHKGVREYIIWRNGQLEQKTS